MNNMNMNMNKIIIIMIINNRISNERLLSAIVLLRRASLNYEMLKTSNIVKQH